MNTTNGYCECGCGEKTNLAKRNRKNKCHKKNEPMRFITGHNSKGSQHPGWKGGVTKHAKGYVLELDLKHPRPHSNNYALQHRLLAEEILGKPLPIGAVVHHDDGDKTNNHRGNLVICQSIEHHNTLHKRGPDGKFCGGVL